MDAIQSCGRTVEAFNTALGELGNGAATMRTVSDTIILHGNVVEKMRLMEAGLTRWKEADLREAARRAELIP